MPEKPDTTTRSGCENTPHLLGVASRLTSPNRRSAQTPALSAGVFRSLPSCQVYDFGVARGVFTAGGRAYHDREVGSATLPDLTSAETVLTAASKIAPGETQRQAKEGAAFVPMALPSAAEVAAVHTQVAELHRQSDIAQAFTALQQNELSALYPEAQKLAVAICNTVEYHLENDEQYAHLDAPARRRLARIWGVVYIYEPNEAPDEGDTNAVNTTLAGPVANSNLSGTP